MSFAGVLHKALRTWRAAGRRGGAWIRGAAGLAVIAAAAGAGAASPTPGMCFGVARSAGSDPNPAWVAQERAAGINYLVLGLEWGRYEPAMGVYAMGAIDALKRQVDQARALGWRVEVRMAWQYPPDWVWSVPEARFRNQYGDGFAAVPASGDNVPDLMFNPVLRQRAAQTLAHLFADLGESRTRIDAMSLGWSTLGEFTYPAARYGGRTNCYWTYSTNAVAAFRQALRLRYGGRIEALDQAWGSTFRTFDEAVFRPGERSADHVRARDFAEWVYDAMSEFLVWQHRELRKHYDGQLVLLCGSWGVRAGQFERAVRGDLDGSSPAEINGEIQRGFDFPRHLARLMRATHDPRIVIQCTWIDSDPKWDTEHNPAPAVWLARLARQNGLACGGEYAGGSRAFDLGVRRMVANGYRTLLYVPESALFEGAPRGLDQWADAIRRAGRAGGD